MNINMRLLMTTAMLCLAVVILGQDFKGRVYRTSDPSAMRKFIINMIEKDPDFQKEDAKKTPQELQRERETRKLYLNFFDINMEVTFKSKNRFTMKMDFDIPKEVHIKGKTVKLSWSQRTVMKLPYNSLFLLLNKELGKERTCHPKAPVFFQDEDFKITMRSGGKVLEVYMKGDSWMEGLSIPLKRIK